MEVRSARSLSRGIRNRKTSQWDEKTVGCFLGIMDFFFFDGDRQVIRTIVTIRNNAGRKMTLTSDSWKRSDCKGMFDLM